jgi:hypothetical protein
MNVNKRKNVSLNLNEKCELKNYAKSRPNFKQRELKQWVLEHFNKNISRSAISKILSKDNEEVMTPTTVYRHRRVKHPEIEEDLKKWFFKYESQAIISDSMIIEKANELALKHKMPTNSLSFSDGWLSAFKNRNGIKRMTRYGEAMSANNELIEESIPKLKEVIEKYHPNDVYNFDETALFYRMRPDKSLASKSVPGFKRDKQRITIGLCVNATGTDKICPLVIGKAEKPRCFKNVNLTNIGIVYRFNAKAWMTVSIFQEWIKIFDKIIRLENPDRKVLLLLDNVGSHKLNGVQLKNTELLFLPPNSTTRIQPLDAGIISSFKAKYKQKFIRYLLQQIETNPLDQKKLDLLSAIKYVVSSWEEVSVKTIENCWHKTQLISNNQSLPDNESMDDLTVFIDQINLQNPMTSEEYINMPEERIIEEIYDVSIGSDSSDSDNCDIIDETPNQEKVKLADAMTACDVLMRFFEQQDKDYSGQMRSLRQINANLSHIQSNPRKQTSILDYFH